jgi:hypothetical protein
MIKWSYRGFFESRQGAMFKRSFFSQSRICHAEANFLSDTVYSNAVRGAGNIFSI